MQAQHLEQVVQKLQALAPNRLNEVEDFIDFLSQREKGNEKRGRKIWQRFDTNLRIYLKSAPKQSGV